MQSVMLSTKPPSSNQNDEDFLPGVFELKHGLLYPRWMVLSAIFIILLGILLYVDTYFVPCAPGISSLLNPYCLVDSSTLLVQLLCIAIVFFLGWVLCFLFGYQFLEYSTKKGPVIDFLSTISDLTQIRSFFAMLAIPLYFSTIAMWLFDKIAAFPLTLAIIFIATSLWVFLYKENETPISWEEKHPPTFGYLFRCLRTRRRHRPSRSVTIAIYPRSNPPTQSKGKQK